MYSHLHNKQGVSLIVFQDFAPLLNYWSLKFFHTLRLLQLWTSTPSSFIPTSSAIREMRVHTYYKDPRIVRSLGPRVTALLEKSLQIKVMFGLSLDKANENIIWTLVFELTLQLWVKNVRSTVCNEWVTF